MRELYFLKFIFHIDRMRLCNSILSESRNKFRCQSPKIRINSDVNVMDFIIAVIEYIEVVYSN